MTREQIEAAIKAAYVPYVPETQPDDHRPYEGQMWRGQWWAGKWGVETLQVLEDALLSADGADPSEAVAAIEKHARSKQLVEALTMLKKVADWAKDDDQTPEVVVEARALLARAAAKSEGAL